MLDAFHGVATSKGSPTHVLNGASEKPPSKLDEQAVADKDGVVPVAATPDPNVVTGMEGLAGTNLDGVVSLKHVGPWSD